MSAKINGDTFYYVDTVCVDEIIYDVYQNDNGDVIYKAIDSLF